MGCVAAVVLLAAQTHAGDVARMAQEQAVAQTIHQSLEPPAVAAGFQTDHASRRKAAAELRHRFLRVVMEVRFAGLSRRSVQPGHFLIPSMKIHSDKIVSHSVLQG